MLKLNQQLNRVEIQEFEIENSIVFNYFNNCLLYTSSHLIYPSHLKYEQSRKMPYLAMIDQLNRFIRQPNSLLIVSGYSFND